MKIATLSIGTELLLGETPDSNAACIAAALADAGLEVRRHMVVRDDEVCICRALQELSETNDVVVVTGGLGTEAHDATAAGAAEAAGAVLVPFDEEVPDSPLMPHQATVLRTAAGKAAGFSMQLNRATLSFLPGTPSSMEDLLRETVLPALAQEAPAREVLKLFGMTKEAAAAAIAEVLPWDMGLRIWFREKEPELHLVLTTERHDAAKLADVAAIIRRKLEPHVFASGAETLDSVLVSLFRATGATLSLAESCTGGLIAARITEQAGSSGWLLEGAVTYSNAAKTRNLGVPAALIEEHGAVSAEVAVAMATGSRAAAGSDIALSVTGIAGPEGGSPHKPVGTVYIALADKDGCKAERHLFPGDRQQVRNLTVFTALDWLRRRLLSVVAEEEAPRGRPHPHPVPPLEGEGT